LEYRKLFVNQEFFDFDTTGIPKIQNGSTSQRSTSVNAWLDRDGVLQIGELHVLIDLNMTVKAGLFIVIFFIEQFLQSAVTHKRQN
jgi:hypothetical protein